MSARGIDRVFERRLAGVVNARVSDSAAPMAWLSPSWIGNDALKHVWFVEAPAGGFWDLSKAGATLHLDFAHTEVGGTGAVQANPHLDDAHHNLARLLERLGRTTDAIRHLNTYRRLVHGV